MAAVVGIVYYLVARLSVGLILKPEGVAVFWPAAGISSGLLIALGRWARWPVSAGVIAATVAVHLAIADPLWAGVAPSNTLRSSQPENLLARVVGPDHHSRPSPAGLTLGFGSVGHPRSVKDW
jgi:hypothetical protein